MVTRKAKPRPDTHYVWTDDGLAGFNVRRPQEHGVILQSFDDHHHITTIELSNADIDRLIAALTAERAKATQS